MYVINANFGNHSIALMQWVFEQSLQNVTVVSIDTGFAAENWLARVNESESLAKKLGFKTVRLNSRPDFTTQILDRAEFPTTKFQWCASFLKGLTLLNWLECEDPHCKATILMGKRFADSQANHNISVLPTYSQHFGDRQIWHPLLAIDDAQFKSLVSRTGLKWLTHRSLECQPCVFTPTEQLYYLASADIKKVQKIEEKIKKPMFAQPIKKMLQITTEKHPAEHDSTGEYTVMKMFDMGCGAPYACGE